MAADLRYMSRAVEESEFRINKTDIRPRRLDVQRHVHVICNIHSDMQANQT